MKIAALDAATRILERKLCATATQLCLSAVSCPLPFQQLGVLNVSDPQSYFKLELPATSSQWTSSKAACKVSWPHPETIWRHLSRHRECPTDETAKTHKHAHKRTSKQALKHTRKHKREQSRTHTHTPRNTGMLKAPALAATTSGSFAFCLPSSEHRAPSTCTRSASNIRDKPAHPVGNGS